MHFEPTAGNDSGNLASRKMGTKEPRDTSTQGKRDEMQLVGVDRGWVLHPEIWTRQGHEKRTEQKEKALEHLAHLQDIAPI